MIELEPFCAKDDIANGLDQPWREGNDAFATNQFVAVMVRGGADPEMRDAPAKMDGKIKRLLEKAEDCRTEIQIKLPKTEAEECSACNGSGWVVTEQCPDCDGEGDFDHGSHTYTCHECGGAGDITHSVLSTNTDAIECEGCDGTGRENRFLDFNAGGVTYKYQEKFLRLIAALPGFRMYVSGDNLKAARFEFDRGCGLIAPIGPTFLKRKAR